MLTATAIARRFEDALNWCRQRRWRVLFASVVLLGLRNWFWTDDSANPKIGTADATMPAATTRQSVSAQVDGSVSNSALPQPEEEHHTFLGKAIASADGKFNESEMSPEQLEAFERGRAVLARIYNSRLNIIALNELPFTSEINKIYTPRWGYRDDVLVAVAPIIYLTDEGKTLVAIAHFSGGKWTIQTDVAQGSSPQETAEVVHALFDNYIERPFDVSE